MLSRPSGNVKRANFRIESGRGRLRTINELAKEGFVVRGLFDFGKVGVLLERSVNGAD